MESPYGSTVYMVALSHGSTLTRQHFRQGSIHHTAAISALYAQQHSPYRSTIYTAALSTPHHKYTRTQMQKGWVGTIWEGDAETEDTFTTDPFTTTDPFAHDTFTQYTSTKDTPPLGKSDISSHTSCSVPFAIRTSLVSSDYWRFHSHHWLFDMDFSFNFFLLQSVSERFHGVTQLQGRTQFLASYQKIFQLSTH